MGVAKLFIAVSAIFFAGLNLARAGAEGSVITWGNPSNIAGDSDVLNDGTTVAAFNMNGSAVTVNGVPFNSWTYSSPSTATTMGNFTFAESPNHILAGSGFGSNNNPFASLSVNYQTLLSTGITTDDNNTLTLTITNLVPLQKYEFQFWVSASDLPSPAFTTVASAPNNVTLHPNTSDADGGVGQFVVGTFTAADPTEVITFNGSDSTQAPLVNAFQLRAVPEPAASSILLLGGSVLLLLRRRPAAK